MHLRSSARLPRAVPICDTPLPTLPRELECSVAAPAPDWSSVLAGARLMHPACYPAHMRPALESVEPQQKSVAIPDFQSLG